MVRLYDAGQIQGLRYMAMEKVAGQTLAELLRAGPLPPAEAARIVAGVADGVAAAHALRILHRDLKPDNVLLSAGGTPRLSDFGLARVDGRRMTQTGEVLGTPYYMAPEQAQGERERLGPATDVYGLGAVLYAALGADPPYHEQGGMLAVLSAIVDGPPRPLSPRVPADLRAVVGKAMEREPADRYASALELRDDLQRFLSGAPVLARPQGTVARWTRRARQQGPVALASVLVTLGLCALVYLAGRPYLAGLSDAALQADAVAWREAELTRLEAEVAPDPALLRARLAALELQALEQRAEVALGVPAAARGVLRRALDSDWDAACAPLRARLYLQLGELGSSAALTSAALVAPESPAGRAARLELARRLLAHGEGRDPDAVREAEALLTTLVGSGGGGTTDPAARAALRPLARLRAGAMDWAGAGALLMASGPSPDDDPLQALVSAWGERRALSWEEGESFLAALEPGLLTRRREGARLYLPDGSRRELPAPREGLVVLAAGWGRVRGERPELTLAWGKPGLAVWEGVDVRDKSGDDGRSLIWQGPPPQGLRQVAFGDLDGDARLDLTLVGWEGGPQSKAVLSGGRELPLFAPGTEPPYAIARVLALDLDGAGGDELVLAPSDLAPRAEVRVLGLREGEFQLLGALPLGAVSGARVVEESGRARALLTLDGEPGQRVFGVGTLEQEGHALLGWGAKGPELRARWVQPGEVGDAARYAHRLATAWIVEVGARPALLRGWAAPDASYWLELADLERLAADPAAAPRWRLHLPATPAGSPEQGAGLDLLWGGQSYTELRRAAAPSESLPLAREPWPKSGARRLAWAARVLRVLDAPAASEALRALRERFPESRAAQEAALDAATAQVKAARRFEALSQSAFGARQAEPARAAWAEAEAGYREAAAAAEALASEVSTGDWEPPRVEAWALAAGAWVAASEFERALRALDRALELPHLSPSRRAELERERDRLAPLHDPVAALAPLDLAAPALLLSPQAWPSTAGGLRLQVSAENTEGWLVPLADPGPTWELRAEFELHGSAWCGSFDLGISESVAGGEPQPLSGVHVSLWDVHKRRPIFVPRVGGQLAGSRRYVGASFTGRLALSLRSMPSAGGATQILWELRDAEGRLALQDVFVHPRAWAPRGALFLGLQSPAAYPDLASLEQSLFGQLGWVTLTNVTLRAPQAGFAQLSQGPDTDLWRGHAEQARGDMPAALRAYAAGLERLTAALPGQEGFPRPLSARERQLRLELLFGQGLARHGAGDRSGHLDLVQVLREAPDRACLLLETLSSGAPRAFEREAVQAALALLEADEDPLLVAVSSRYRGNFQTRLPPPPEGDLVRLRTHLRLAVALSSAGGDREGIRSLRARLRALTPGDQLPRAALPRVFPPPGLRAGESLDTLLASNKSLTRRLSDGRRAVAIAPHDPRGWLLQAGAFAEAGLLGLAADAAHQALWLEVSPADQSLALEVLAGQSFSLGDELALAAYTRALEQLGAPQSVLEGLRRQQRLLREGPGPPR